MYKRQLLTETVFNLCDNAIKYNKPGGSIDTYAKELSCDGTTVWYEFRITDTGIGMSRDFVENQLFKPFNPGVRRRPHPVQGYRPRDVHRQGVGQPDGRQHLC